MLVTLFGGLTSLRRLSLNVLQSTVTALVLVLSACDGGVWLGVRTLLAFRKL